MQDVKRPESKIRERSCLSPVLVALVGISAKAVVHGLFCAKGKMGFSFISIYTRHSSACLETHTCAVLILWLYTEIYSELYPVIIYSENPFLSSVDVKSCKV